MIAVEVITYTVTGFDGQPGPLITYRATDDKSVYFPKVYPAFIDMISYIIVHDAPGSSLVVNESESGRDLMHFDDTVDWNGYDELSRLVYFELTGEYASVEKDSPFDVRYSLQSDFDEGLLAGYVLEVIGDQLPTLKSDYKWVTIDNTLLKGLENHCKFREPLRKAVKSIPAEVAADVEVNTIPWFSKGGCVAKTRCTIRAELQRMGFNLIGTVDQVQSGPDSMLFRVKSDTCEIFYKIIGYGSPEAVVAAALGAQLPNHVVVPFGINVERNSFFSQSFGATYWRSPEFEAEEENCMDKVIAKIANFHICSTELVEKIKQFEVLDTSPSLLKRELSEFVAELRKKEVLDDEHLVKMRAVLPEVKSKLQTLIKGKVPVTICHGDLHANNMTQEFEDGEPRLFDWYECTISHPFLDVAGDDLYEYCEDYIRNWDLYDSEDELMEIMIAAKDLVPLWKAYRLVKIYERSKHELEWDGRIRYCRTYMKHLISSMSGSET